MHRSLEHLCQLVETTYRSQRELSRMLGEMPHDRHVKAHLWPVEICFPFGTKSAVALVLVISSKLDKERFNETHCLRLIRSVVPDAAVVDLSYVDLTGTSQFVRVIYLEFQSEKLVTFARLNLVCLEEKLMASCSAFIEPIGQTVFMHQDQEQQARTIMAMSRESRCAADIPRVMIEYTDQECDYLVFQVIIVRAFSPESASLRTLLLSLPQTVNININDLRLIGSFKEAAVLQLKLSLSKFLRKDCSVDLYKAEDSIRLIISRAFHQTETAENRLQADQQTVLQQAKNQLQSESLRYDDLCDRFYLNLTPKVMRSRIDPPVLASLLRLLIESFHRPLKGCRLHSAFCTEKDSWLLVVVRAEKKSFERLVKELLDRWVPESRWAVTSISFDGSYCFGWLCQLAVRVDTVQIQASIDWAMEKWSRHSPLSLAIESEPLSLDPRKGGDRRSQLILRMLFEGLMRIGPNDRPVPGIAKKVKISPDKCIYLFHLRESTWCNGVSLTAKDFEVAWKTALQPGFATLFAYFFYAIKNAQTANKGEKDVEEVGVRAIDEYKLQVELAHPAPYFLYLMANPVFAPLCSQIILARPWAYCDAGEDYACNGPFRLIRWNHGHEIVLEKNRCYWNAESVQVPGIQITISKDKEAMCSAYETGRLDWAGEPLLDLPLDKMGKLEDRDALQSDLSGSIFKLEYNTNSFPLNCRKLRQALFHAIDRQELIDHVLKGGERVATSVNPSCVVGHKNVFVNVGEYEARQLFAEALQELGCTAKELPPIHYMYPCLENYKLMALTIQQQWEEVLGINVVLQSTDYYTFIQALHDADFQIAGAEWYSVYNDPTYNLIQLKERESSFNSTGWCSAEYTALLDAADYQLDLVRRRKLLDEAEQILKEEVPVAPLYEMTHKYMTSSRLLGVYISPLGAIDFRWAYFKEKEEEVR